jgi:hypothetical protein
VLNRRKMETAGWMEYGRIWIWPCLFLGDERDGDYPVGYRKQAIRMACACWLMLLLLLLLLPLLYSTNIDFIIEVCNGIRHRCAGNGAVGDGLLRIRS